MMAAFLLLVQLLFMGTLIVPARTQEEEGCNLPSNATPSNATVQVTPSAYEANTTYTVTISDNRNSTGDKAVSKYLLQALSLQNVSMGEWKVETKNCSSIETAILTAPQNTANWTSPDGNASSVEIRAYIILSDKSAELKTMTLSKEPERTTAAPSTTPDSVSTVQSSSFFIAVLQLLLFLFTSKLFS